MEIEDVYDNLSDKPQDFFERVEKAGGWPIGYKYASFYHSVSNNGRDVMFGNERLREPYWTTRYDADDYYWWKISGAKKAVIASKIRRQFADEMRQRSDEGSDE